MPGLDGISLCKKLRKMEEDQNILEDSLQVLIMSGDGSQEEQMMAREAGAADFIIKPIKFKDLEAKLIQLNLL